MEIGPGLGTLTTFLGAKGRTGGGGGSGPRLYSGLRENLTPYANVQVVWGDIFKLDLGQYFAGSRKAGEGGSQSSLIILPLR
ncbi:MAG: hypothetical protein ACOX3A_08455 [bacterium]